MTEEKKERILEAACAICHWPYTITDEAEMEEKCAHCPVEQAVCEASENDDQRLRTVVQIFVDELKDMPGELAKAMNRRKNKAFTGGGTPDA